MFSSSSISCADSLRSSSLDETLSMHSRLSRPSAKSIYMRRKEYSESINTQLSKFHYRVEHLFTCKLDGVEVSGLPDCVERLKMLEIMGRVWGQEMILEVNNRHLLLTDIETREELDRVPLLSVSDVTAMLDWCVFNSLLMISVCEQQVVTVLMFQCDSLRADYIKRDLDRVLQNPNTDELHTYSVHQSRGAEGRIGTPMMKHTGVSHSSAGRSECSTPPDYDQTPPPTPPTHRREPVYNQTEPQTPPPHTGDTPTHPSPGPSPAPYSERDRHVDVLNHLISDIEQFVAQVVEAAPKAKQKKKKKQKGLPSEERFKICLQKIKMAFNLLAALNGQIQSPSAPELVHCLFSILELVVSRCADDLSPSVVAPLLEPECVRFLSEEATQEEDQLWQSLGDAWNIPRTQWFEDDDEIPTFVPVFDDGWNPRPITHTERKTCNQQERQQGQSISSNVSPEDMPLECMCVLHDFRARNEKELSVRKGEMVEILDMSKRWWRVRDAGGKQGFLPNNVLKSSENEDTQEAGSNPILNRKSRPEEVTAWLQHREFNNITVRCLGGLSGGMLLAMTLEELKAICPEEGRRVYYQLQDIKSTLVEPAVQIIGSSDHRVSGSSDHRVIRSSGHRIIRSSDHQIIGSADHQIIGSADHQIIGSADHQIIGSSDHRVSGSSDHRVIGSADHQIIGSSDHRVIGSADHRVIRSADHRVIGSADHRVIKLFLFDLRHSSLFILRREGPKRRRRGDNLRHYIGHEFIGILRLFD